MDEPALSTALHEELALAHRAADLAAEVTLAAFGGRLPVEHKDDATPVTALDLAAERSIRRAIEDAFPRDAIRGEEQGHRAGTTGRTWLIDPIDGTKMYADGIPLWTTLIALDVDGAVVLGVADVPALGDRYHAVRDGGAWRGDRRLRVSEVATLGDAVAMHASVQEWFVDRADGSLRRLAERVRALRGVADGWAQLLVAQGSAELAIERSPCFAWDFAATGLIVQEAGGRISTLRGTPPEDGGDLLVSNGLVHEETLELLTAPSGER